MTYYEWIDYFYSLQKAPITEDAINKINNSTIDYKGNIKVRFLNQIVKLINIRLNNALDNFLLKTKTLIQDKNVLSIEINDLKKEIIFARQLASTKHFDEDVTKQLLKSIDGFGEEMNNSIKARYANCNNNEIVMLINNIDLNA
ncbi:MAG: hypothetical protein E7162_02785 [Firmicutes bacterium]|nr:hypothetical protein [Bacillota bacterium]